MPMCSRRSILAAARSKSLCRKRRSRCSDQTSAKGKNCGRIYNNNNNINNNNKNQIFYNNYVIH